MAADPAPHSTGSEPPDIAAIRARLAAATPGPWHWDRRKGDEWGHQPPDLVSDDIAAGTWHECTGWKRGEQNCHWGNDETPIRGERGGPHEHFIPASVVSSWGYDADGVEVEDHNADFIAHAPADVAALLADRSRLSGELDALRALFTRDDAILLEKAANTVEDDELPDALRSISARLSSLLPPDSP